MPDIGNGKSCQVIRYEDYKRMRLLVTDSRRFYIFCEIFDIDGFKWKRGTVGIIEN